MPASIYHFKSDTIADFTGTVTQLNSSGGTVTVQATDLVRPSDWNSSHSVALAVAGSEIFSAGFFEPQMAANTNSTLSTLAGGVWYLHPFCLPHAIGSGQFNILAAEAAGFVVGGGYSSTNTSSVTAYQTMNTALALYQLGTGANTTRIESIWSGQLSELFTWERDVSSSTFGGGTTTGVIITNSLQASFPAQWDASGGVTYSTTSVSGTTTRSSSTANSTVADGIITGVVNFASGSRMIPFPFASTLPAGEYLLAIMLSSTSSTTGTNSIAGTMKSTQSFLHILEFVNRAYKVQGKSTSNASTAIMPFHGSVTTVSSAPFSTLGTSDIRNFGAANARLYFNYLQSSY